MQHIIAYKKFFNELREARVNPNVPKNKERLVNQSCNGYMLLDINVEGDDSTSMMMLSTFWTLESLDAGGMALTHLYNFCNKN